MAHALEGWRVDRRGCPAAALNCWGCHGTSRPCCHRSVERANSTHETSICLRTEAARHQDLGLACSETRGKLNRALSAQSLQSIAAHTYGMLKGTSNAQGPDDRCHKPPINTVETQDFASQVYSTRARGVDDTLRPCISYSCRAKMSNLTGHGTGNTESAANQ